MNCHLSTCLAFTFVVPGSVWKNVTDVYHTKQPERYTSAMKNTVFWLGQYFTLKMEAVESSETPANFYRATRCHVASISHICVLLTVHPVPADNPIHHFLWRKGKSLTKECNILRYSHDEGELHALCPSVREVCNWTLHDRCTADGDRQTHTRSRSIRLRETQDMSSNSITGPYPWSVESHPHLHSSFSMIRFNIIVTHKTNCFI